MNVNSLYRVSDTAIILVSSPSRDRLLGRYGAMTQYWKSDLSHCTISSFLSDPNSTIFVTLPSIVYWNAMAVDGNEVARNMEWEGGSSLADKEYIGGSQFGSKDVVPH